MTASNTRWGSGSIRKRPGRSSWELRVSVGRDPVTKRYRYVSRSFTGTKKAAEAALAALLTEVNAGAGGHKGTDSTIGELVELWLDLKKESLSITTWEGYAGKARFRLIPALGDVPVRKLTVQQIDAFYRTMRRDKDLAASTVRQLHNVLSGSLDQAVRWGWRPDNPAKLATLPPQRQGEIHAPTPAEVLRMIDAADPEFATFIRVAAAVGSRRGEVSGLRWSAVNLDGAELKIVRSIVEDPDGVLHVKDTKTHQARRVALDDGTVAALREWRSSQEAVARECGVTLPEEAYVFSPDADGRRPWRPYRWTSRWTRLKDKAGIDKAIRLHDLRHFAATHLLDAGVPVKTVSGRLGHARPGTTLNVYAQFVPATDQTAAKVMGRLLDH